MSLQVHVLIECLERDVSDERDPGYLYCLLPLHRTRQILAPYPLQQGTHNAPTIRILIFLPSKSSFFCTKIFWLWKVMLIILYIFESNSIFFMNFISLYDKSLFQESNHEKLEHPCFWNLSLSFLAIEKRIPWHSCICYGDALCRTSCNVCGYPVEPFSFF